MKHDPEAAARREQAVNAARRQQIRDSYARDLPLQQVRYVMELHLAQGDARLCFRNGMPEQSLADQLSHIFALWRTA